MKIKEIRSTSPAMQSDDTMEDIVEESKEEIKEYMEQPPQPKPKGRPPKPKQEEVVQDEDEYDDTVEKEFRERLEVIDNKLDYIYSVVFHIAQELETKSQPQQTTTIRPNPPSKEFLVRKEKIEPEKKKGIFSRFF
jgi:hypothetical protein